MILNRTRWLFPFLFLFSTTFLAGCLLDRPDSISEVAKHGLYSASLSEDGSTLVVGSMRHGGSLWHLIPSYERLYDWNHQSGQYSQLTNVNVSRDGLFALTAMERQVVVWRTQTGESLGFWLMPDRVVDSALSDAGAYALVALENNTLFVIDLAKAGFVARIDIDSPIKSIDISANGGLGVVGAEDGDITAWVLESGKRVRLWSLGEPISKVVLSPEANLVFAASKYRGAAVWGGAEDKQLGKIEIKRGAAVTAARFVGEHNNQLLIALSDRKIRLVDWRSGETLRHWHVPRRNIWKPEGTLVYDMAFSKGNDLFAVSSSGALYHWLVQ